MAANDTRRLKVVVTGDSSDAQQALEQVGTAADQSDSKLMGLTKTLIGFGAKGAILLGAVGAAAVTMGVSTASQLEQVEVGFTTMLGSAEKAKKFMKELQNFAAATPFEFTELTGAAQQFLAMGFAAKDVIPMLTAVGDAVAAMGGSAENVDSVTRALGQMQAKGKVSGEELMQLTEQGIPALKILADSYKVSTSDMSKMIEKGMVMSDKAIPALIKGLSEGTEHVKGFGGMMAKQSETMKGKWSTFMDTLQMGLGNIAKNIIPTLKTSIDTLSRGMADFFNGIQGKDVSSILGQLGLGLTSFFKTIQGYEVKTKGIAQRFADFGVAIRAAITAFQDGKTASDGWTGRLELIAVGLKKVIDGLIWFGKETANVVMWLYKYDDVAKALVITLGALMAVTKAHAFVMGVQAAGGALAMFKNLTLVATITKTVTALQWAYNGAMSAAAYLQIAGYLTLIAAKQKIMAIWTKVLTAAQWAWDAALNANPIGLIVAAIVILVGAIYLLWKNNEGFRKFVLNTLWPTIKKVFEAIKNIVMIVVKALVTAFMWSKEKIMAIWNAIADFMAPIIAKIVAFISPLISIWLKVAKIMTAFYVNVWKIIWIAIQIAAKLVVMWFQNFIVPGFKLIFNAIAGTVKFLYGVFKAYFTMIKNIVTSVANWINTEVITRIKLAWEVIKKVTAILWSDFVKRFNAIKDKVTSVFNAIVGPIAAIFYRGVNNIKAALNVFRAYWNQLFDGVKSKAGSTMDAVTRAFNKGKDGIKAAWDKIKSITKAPINFVIQDVYNDRIRSLWNKVAEKFGIKTRLDTIPKLAKGGVVGSGYGTKDDQLSLLMRGEGVLNTREMRKLGGPQGFQEFRNSLAMYGNGGVVGGDGPGSWFKSLASKGKDIFQGLAGSVIKPLVGSIRGFINGHLDSNGFGGLMRGGANTILDKLVGWVAGKDKEVGSIGGAGGAIGWKAMQKLISNQFPGLHMISGFRPGARTLSGNASYHGFGRAVDYPPNRALALWIRSVFGSKTKELITPWNDLNLHNGRPHKYTGAVWNQHNFAGGNAHDHWAMDRATTVDPGWFMGYNGTGKPETLVNADKIGSTPSNVTINIYDARDPKATAIEVRNQLLALSRRNGGRSGLPNS